MSSIQHVENPRELKESRGRKNTGEECSKQNLCDLFGSWCTWITCCMWSWVNKCVSCAELCTGICFILLSIHTQFPYAQLILSWRMLDSCQLFFWTWISKNRTNSTEAHHEDCTGRWKETHQHEITAKQGTSSYHLVHVIHKIQLTTDFEHSANTQDSSFTRQETRMALLSNWRGFKLYPWLLSNNI